MSSFCTAKATHIFSKKFQHICVSLDVNFNKSLTNDIVSFEQLGPAQPDLNGVDWAVKLQMKNKSLAIFNKVSGIKSLDFIVIFS